MAQFSLDDIRDAAEKKYGTVEITFGDDSVRLTNPLRMSEERREKLGAVQDEINEGDTAEVTEKLAEALRIAAEDVDAANRLLAAIDGDLPTLISVFETYTNGVQAGEA